MILEEKICAKRHVLVGIGFDGHAKELLEWALEKVALSGDSVAALHVCRNSDSTSKAQVLMDGYLADYQEICHQKKVGISVEVVKGSSIRKLLVREAKNRSSAVVIVGINKNSPLGLRGKVSIAKYCAKKLSLSTEVMAVHNGKVVYSNCSNGSQINLRTGSDVVSEFGDSEVSKDEVLSGSSFLRRAGRSLSSISLPVEEFTQQKPGWPLLQTASEVTQLSKAARKMSVVQWVMTLPSRSSMLEYPQLKSKISDDFENLALKLRSNKCKLLSYEILKAATCQFSSDNLIGKGGCNSVYKGVLPDGKNVAIKVLKTSSKDSWKWKEFALEVEIMTVLKHKNITRLLGICVAEDSLISVHNLLPKGNLEENLHGNNDRVLPWEARFKIAIGIAEALNYLHNECVQPVIHRDVKSSNILLTDEFNPQLSDFGLSTWGPTEAASFITDSDLVGTFGYLAPEYFMYGKVSNKVDVYSFGVVLLELLSGRRAIGSEASKGEESLVIWAKPKLDNGDLNGILDQNLGKNVDDAQMQRIAFAAKKCLTQAARLRPHMNQVLKILNGDEEEMNAENDQFEGDCGDDEEVYPDSSAAESSHLSIALRDVYDNSGSFSSQDQSSPLSVEEYLRRRWSRSSSLE